MRLAPILLVSLLSSCTTTKHAPCEDALSRFERLLPFVPADMQSYWFRDGRGLEGMELNRLEPDVLQVHAGRDFEAPHLANVGAHAFVVVSWRPPGLPPPGIDEEAAYTNDEPLDGMSTYRATEPQDGTFPVVAFPGDGITVRASTRALLAAALRRTGSRELLLRRLPPPSALSASSRELMLLLPRPQPDQAPHFQAPLLCGAPSPTTQLFAESTLDDTGYVGLRLIGTSHEALTAYASDWRAFSHLRAGEVHAHGEAFAIDFEMRDPSGLFLFLLFGLHLLI